MFDLRINNTGRRISFNQAKYAYEDHAHLSCVFPERGHGGDQPPIPELRLTTVCRVLTHREQGPRQHLLRRPA